METLLTLLWSFWSFGIQNSAAIAAVLSWILIFLLSYYIIKKEQISDPLKISDLTPGVEYEVLCFYEDKVWKGGQDEFEYPTYVLLKPRRYLSDKVLFVKIPEHKFPIGDPKKIIVTLSDRGNILKELRT